MNNKKQKLLVEYLVSSKDTFALCKAIVKPHYFDPDLRPTVEFIHEFFDFFHTTPSPAQIEAETDYQLTLQPITKADIEYCATEVEKFCKRKAMEHAIRSAPKLMDTGSGEDYGKVEQMIKDAVSVSLNRSLGLSYFDNPIHRLSEQAKQPLRTSTGWTQWDDLMAGGLARGEMILLSANSGGGKSITLANLAVNFLAQKLNVLYISLELSENLIAQRFDTMYTGVSSVLSRERYRDIASKVAELGETQGELNVKYMPAGTNTTAIRAYIKEFELQHGYVPDLLIVDYLDIMGANEHVSADNVSEKDKRASEQLRSLGIEYNMFMATASQQNRSAVEAKDLNHSHIAGGMTKINTVDWYVSIIMNPVMKAAGEIGFAFLKTRSSDGVGKTAFMTWDNQYLLVRDRQNQGSFSDTPKGFAPQVKTAHAVKMSLVDMIDM